VTVEVVLSEPRKYPKTAAELRCREDAEVETTLQVLADRTSFALPKLLDDLCDLYGIESGGVFERIQYVEKEGKEEESEEEEEEEESEYGQDEDDTVDMAEAEDRDLTIACAQRHGRWERQEAAVSAASTAGLSRSRDQRLAEERQIFAPKEAFQMLSNELLAIFRRGQVGERPITADAEGDNVYQWLVRMGHFDPGSQLGKDLQLLKASHGIDTVELSVTFTRGLHPFYPPKVQLIRPRMPVIILSALASHPLLSLELWDPWKPCEKWLSLLKEFLQVSAWFSLHGLLTAQPAVTWTGVCAEVKPRRMEGKVRVCC
jgi:baculoviral IAP repeat-containing protein 6